MTARLSSAMLVSALIRRVEIAGGSAMVLAKGDPGGGAVILACAERGLVSQLLERVLGIDGVYAWSRCGPDAQEGFAQYLERRRASDPDIWIIELDIAGAERFAAEMIASD
jgi:hypothetical protein